MRYYFLILLFLLISLYSLGQRVVNICGEYKYIVPENVSLAEAKAIAIERARLTAIANEFGTTVSQTNLATTHIENGTTRNDFLSLGETEVKGDWLGDTKEPEIRPVYENNQLVIYASVCGKVRELKTAEVELRMQIMSNGIETERFKNNDKVAIRFKSPVNGYVAIFVRDDNAGIVSCMLPYANENGKARVVKNSKEYIYLSTDDPIYPYQEETILVTNKKVEFNTFVLVFAEKEFAMPLSDMGEFVPELSIEHFQRWLRKNRINDKTMQTIEKTIQINK